MTLASCLAVILMSLCPDAAASRSSVEYPDPITERAWLDDPEGVFTPQEVLGKTWSPFRELLTRGLTRSTTWVRLTIDPSLLPPARASADSRLVLLLIPVHLDEIEIFRVGHLDEEPVVVGDRYLADEPRQILPNFMELETGQEKIELLLRIRTVANVAFYPMVKRWDSARDISFRLQQGLNIYIMFTLMTAIWGLYIWFESRERLTIFFVVQQFSHIAATYYLHGFAQLSELSWVRMLSDSLTSILIPSSAVCTIWFHSLLLSELGARKSDIKLLKFAALCNLVATVIIVGGWINIGLQISHIAISFSLVWFVVTTLRMRQSEMPDLIINAGYTKIYLVLVYLLVCVIILPQFNRGYDLDYLGTKLFSAFWAQGRYLVHSVATTLLIGGLVVYRNKQRRNIENLRQVNSKVLAATIETQSDLINMLAHELKTPLSVISIALGQEDGNKKQIRRSRDAVKSISKVINDCEALVNAETRASRSSTMSIERFRLSEVFVEQLDFFDDSARISLEVVENEVNCVGDKSAMALIFRNLIDNALKYSPDNSEILAKISVSEQDGALGMLFSISNRPASSIVGNEIKQDLFKRYYRGDGARKVSGSGIGLYLSLRTAELCGALLTVERFDSEEVRFALWVPGSK